MQVGLSVVVGGVLVGGVALSHPNAAAVGALLVALTATGIHLRRPGSRLWWMRSWQLILAGVILLPISTLVERHGTPGVAAVLLALAALLSAIGMAGVLRDRTSRGRAMDATLEVLLATSSIAFIVGTTTTEIPVVGMTTLLATTFTPLFALATLWLLVHVSEASPDSHLPIWLAAGGAILVLAASALRAIDLLIASSQLSAAPPTAMLLAGVVAWSGAVMHPSVADPGPTLPVAGPDLRATNFFTVLVPLLLGPLAAVLDLTGTEDREWVAIIGAFVIPLLVVWLLARQVRLRTRREYLAQHDPLTGLPNQRLFLDQIEIELAQTRRTLGGFTIMFLDLDRFKVVNDSLGHDVGDQLLRAVAERLQEACDDGTVIARVGGDEFTVLVPGVTDPSTARSMATALQSAFTRPLTVGNRELFTGASVGVAIAPHDGETAVDLLKHADTAMYRAKMAGSGRVQLYTVDLNTRARLRLVLENHLRRAIERGELVVHYQPKVRAEDHVVVGHEALVRWNHPHLGLLSPSGFISLAEDTGLIVDLGRWVLHEACRQAARWLDEGQWCGPVAVNISPRQIAETPLDALVEEAISATGIHPRLLEVEITETCLLHDVESVAEAAGRLRRRGVSVTLDDFGTGYSGLGYVARLPLDRLKLDRSFVASITREGAASPIVDAVLALAASLGLEVVAEGVETEYQARWLRAHGCDTFQGYYFGAPKPVHDVIPVPLSVDPLMVNRAIHAVCTSGEPIDPAEVGAVLTLLERSDHPSMAPTGPRERTRTVVRSLVARQVQEA